MFWNVFYSIYLNRKYGKSTNILAQNSRYLEDEEIRFNTRRAAMELGDDFDFDELKIYHYPDRHPDMEMTAQAGILGIK